MVNRLENIIKIAVSEFHKKTASEINDGIYKVPGKNKDVKFNKKILQNALKTICPLNKEHVITENLISHYRTLESLIPYCSSPKSFRTAWGLRSEILNKYDANTIVNEGGQIIPENKTMRLFQTIQQGVELSINQRIVSFVRHSEGNYDDELDLEGRFTYQSPEDATGMLRYRWCQYLSKKLENDLIVIAVMWFKMMINDIPKYVFVAAPAKIIEWNDDTQNLGSSIQNPLKLQIIERQDVFNFINLLQSNNQTKIEIKTRRELPQSLSREWSYDRLNTTKKGTQIKTWAKKVGKTCPGPLCNHTPFEKLSNAKIAFGHIVSQNWSRSFTFLLEKKDHPDNLYLTCARCNSSLSDNFPDTDLKNEMMKDDRGTIGDWLRSAELDIRKS
jgi:hypothetical protein